MKVFTREISIGVYRRTPVFLTVYLLLPTHLQPTLRLFRKTRNRIDASDGTPHRSSCPLCSLRRFSHALCCFFWIVVLILVVYDRSTYCVVLVDGERVGETSVCPRTQAPVCKCVCLETCLVGNFPEKQIEMAIVFVFSQQFPLSYGENLSICDVFVGVFCHPDCFPID